MEKTASQLIKDWLDMEGRKSRWLAEAVMVDKSTFSQWLSGKRVPRRASRVRLAEITGLPVQEVDAWKK